VLVKPFEPQMVINRVKDLIAGKRPLAAAFQAPGTAPEPSKAPAPPMPASEYFNRLNAALGTKEPEKPSARPTAADLADELANWQPESPATPDKPADSSLIRPETPASTFAEASVDKPSTSAPAPASVPTPATSAPASTFAEATVDKPATSVPAPTFAKATVDKPSSSAPARSSSASAPSTSPSALSTSPSAPSTSVPPTLAEAFAALLAAEQGKVAPAPSINQQALGEDVIEQVTRRVVERMADTAVRQVVLDVAERLVREEIDRIKGSSR
jgi:hypothetical protein